MSKNGTDMTKKKKENGKHGIKKKEEENEQSTKVSTNTLYKRRATVDIVNIQILLL